MVDYFKPEIFENSLLFDFLVKPKIYILRKQLVFFQDEKIDTIIITCPFWSPEGKGIFISGKVKFDSPEITTVAIGVGDEENSGTGVGEGVFSGMGVGLGV